MTEIEIKGEKYMIMPVSPTAETQTNWLYNICVHHNLEFQFRYSTATESDFEKVVEYVTVQDEKYYNDYTGLSDVIFDARIAFVSLLQHHSLDPNADYIILKRK